MHVSRYLYFLSFHDSNHVLSDVNLSKWSTILVKLFTTLDPSTYVSPNFLNAKKKVF